MLHHEQQLWAAPSLLHQLSPAQIPHFHSLTLLFLNFILFFTIAIAGYPCAEAEQEQGN